MRENNRVHVKLNQSVSSESINETNAVAVNIANT